MSLAVNVWREGEEREERCWQREKWMGNAAGEEDVDLGPRRRLFNRDDEQRTSLRNGRLLATWSEMPPLSGTHRQGLLHVNEPRRKRRWGASSLLGG
jgi:hypothetical protein